MTKDTGTEQQEAAPVESLDPALRLPLTFTAPRRGKPPKHLADLSRAERRELVSESGLPAFRADQFMGMRSEAEIGKYLDATAAYLPLANSFRMQVNAKSLHPDVPGGLGTSLSIGMPPSPISPISPLSSASSASSFLFPHDARLSVISDASASASDAGMQSSTPSPPVAGHGRGRSLH